MPGTQALSPALPPLAGQSHHRRRDRRGLPRQRPVRRAQDDPEFGYRYLVEDAREAGEPIAERTAWRICTSKQWWSVFGKKNCGNDGKVGPPVHDDLIERDFTADVLNRLWLSDITEHRNREGKLYPCAIKDVFSNRIVGYSAGSRMKSRLATAALHNAVARRGEVAGRIVHSDRGSGQVKEIRARARLP